MPVLSLTGDVSARPLPTWLRRRWSLLAVSALLTASTFLQDRGRLVADTKTDLVVDPGAFLQRSLDLWDPSASFGRIQNQAVGYWFPMGPFFWLGDRLGVPPWVTQRLWWSVILVLGLWGLVKLAEAFDVGTAGSRLIGAVAFATGPAILVELGSRSPNVLPIALLPFVLLPLVHGSRQGSVRRSACASALVVLAMGGVNATTTGAVLLVPVVFLVTRRPGPRRRALTVWWIGSVALVTLWWWAPLLLQQRYSFDILAYTEDAAATTNAMSLTETMRGTGFWLARLRDAGLAWLPAGWQYATNPVAILGTAVVTATGLAGLAHRRLPERTFLALCLALGVGAMGAGFAGELGGPISVQVQDLLDGPLGVIRNIHKLVPLVALPVALGVAHALGLVSGSLPRPPPAGRPGRALPVLAALGVGAALVAASLPLGSRELAQSGSFERVPGYWSAASNWLDGQRGGDRVLLLPGNSFAHYRWGAPTDEPLQALLDGPWAVRDIIPFGGVRSTRLLDGYEELFDDGRTPAGLAESLARSGIGWVVVRNDLDTTRAAAPDPPFVVDAIDGAPGLRPVVGFGPAVEVDLTRERVTPTLEPGRTVRAVEIYRVEPEAERVAAYDLPTSLAVVGSTETVQTLADQGLLEDRGVVLAGDDPELARDAGRWVITDDLRRRDVNFGRVHDAASYTLQTDDPAPPSDFADDEVGDVVDRLLESDEQSVTPVELEGVRALVASSYYTGFAREPGYQPYAAIDSDPSTAWHLAGFRDPEDEWWRIQFDQPQNLSAVEIRLPDVGPDAGSITEVQVTTDAGSVEGAFASPDDVLRLSLPPGPTGEVEITILAAEPTGAELLPLGIAEITFDGLAPIERVLVTPEVSRAEPVAVVVARESSDPFDALADAEDLVLDRRVVIPTDAIYALTGTAVAVPGDDLTELVQRTRPRSRSAMTAEATSTRGELPAFAPFQAVDGDPTTAWVADITDPSPSIDLRWDEPRRIDGLELTFPADRPAMVTITTASGSETIPMAPDGSVTFDPVISDRIRISAEATDGSSGIVGLAEVDLLPPSTADAEDVVPPAEVAVDVPCGSGPEVVIDGAAVPTRVSGTLEDLQQLRPMALEACEAVALDAGAHRITGPAAGPFQAESIVLDPPPPLGPGRTRDASVVRWSDEDREVRLEGGEAAALLTLSENRNDGWVATLDGEELRPTTVDGWRQAWVVPPGDGGVVRITYPPGALYDRMLVVGAILVLLMVAAALLPDQRGRRRREPASPRSISDGVIVGAATVALALASGVVALIVPMVWLAVRRPGARVAIAAGSFLAMGTVMVVDPRFPGPELSAPGQLLTGLAVAAALVGPAVSPMRGRRRDPDPS